MTWIAERFDHESWLDAVRRIAGPLASEAEILYTQAIASGQEEWQAAYSALSELQLLRPSNLE